MTAAYPYQQMLVSPLVGGAAKLAMQMHAHIVGERGPVSRLLVPGGGDAERALVAQNFEYIRYDLDSLVSRSKPRSLLANARLALRLWPERRGILHFHSPFVYGAARPFLLATGYRRVLHVHLDYSVEQLTWPLQLPPDLILLSAKSIRPQVDEALARHPGNRTRVHVLQNAVNMEVFRRADRAGAKTALGLDPANSLAVIIANIAPHKGQDTAIRAVAETARQHPGLQLWIIGEDRGTEGQHLLHLQTLCAQLGAGDRVKFLGFRNDIPEILRAADFLLLPSTSETLSLVILEAQASGAVVLAAPTADIPEVVIDGQSGFLIGASDAAQYARRLGELIADPALAARLADNAHARIRDRHQMKVYCKAVLDAYDSLEGKGASP
jgi:glycosyltransferase involved in cell wall biosynthesis